jgi:hypothetical protein
LDGGAAAAVTGEVDIVSEWSRYRDF